MEIKFYLTGDNNILCSYNVNSNKVSLSNGDDDIMLRYNLDTHMLTCEDDEREITQEELQPLFDELKKIGAVK